VIPAAFFASLNACREPWKAKKRPEIKSDRSIYF
jgi:hypothetical protein